MYYVSQVRTPWDALPVPGSLSSVVKQCLGVRCSASDVSLSLSHDRKESHSSLSNLDEANVILARELIRKDSFL